jgi:hypothetical protein
MKRLNLLTICLAFFTPLIAAAQTAPSDDALVRMGAYVVSDDLAASQSFYRALLARDPSIALEYFIAFDVAGGWFALASRERYAPGSEAGSGAVPYIEAQDLERIRTRFTDFTGRPAPAIIVEPGISLLKLTDPDGQLVEFFQLTGS